MPVDFTFLEPDGLQIHIRLNSLLSGHGFFRSMTPEAKRQFDEDVEKIISEYLPYSGDDDPAVVNDEQRVEGK